MNAWQVDAMWETEAAAEWERQQKPDPMAKKLKKAAGCIISALSRIDDGLNWLADAADKVSDTPEADKILSFMRQIEDLANELEALNEPFERGERE